MISTIAIHWFRPSSIRRAVTLILPLCASLNEFIAEAGPLRVQPAESSVSKEISEVAVRWMDALLKRDYEALASLSIPEYRAGIRNGLADTRSNMYSALYGRKTSPYRKFQKIRDIQVIALSHKNIEAFGQGTTACFFDGRNPPNWPSDSATLPAIEKRDDVYCIFLTRSNGRWEVSTDFVERH